MQDLNNDVIYSSPRAGQASKVCGVIGQRDVRLYIQQLPNVFNRVVHLHRVREVVDIVRSSEHDQFAVIGGGRRKVV